MCANNYLNIFRFDTVIIRLIMVHGIFLPGIVVSIIRLLTTLS